MMKLQARLLMMLVSAPVFYTSGSNIFWPSTIFAKVCGKIKQVLPSQNGVLLICLADGHLFQCEA